MSDLEPYSGVVLLPSAIPTGVINITEEEFTISLHTVEHLVHHSSP